MRLRKECEHGRYDGHFPPNEDLPGWQTKYAQMGYERETKGWYWCPGGEFLPEGALVIEPGDSPKDIMQWFFDHGFEEHDCAKYSETSVILRASDNARLMCRWVLPASQVGESE